MLIWPEMFKISSIRTCYKVTHLISPPYLSGDNELKIVSDAVHPERWAHHSRFAAFCCALVRISLTHTCILRDRFIGTGHTVIASLAQAILLSLHWHRPYCYRFIGTGHTVIASLAQAILLSLHWHRPYCYRFIGTGRTVIASLAQAILLSLHWHRPYCYRFIGTGHTVIASLAQAILLSLHWHRPYCYRFIGTGHTVIASLAQAILLSTHWGQDIVVDIFRTDFSNAFSKICVFINVSRKFLIHS